MLVMIGINSAVKLNFAFRVINESRMIKRLLSEQSRNLNDNVKFMEILI